MERDISKQASDLLIWTLFAVLLSQNLLIHVMSRTVEDQKTYYPPDPNAGTPPTPTGSNRSPPQVTPPSNGPGGSYGSTPPSHGGGNHGGTPHCHCGNPPSGGHYDPSPTPPTGGGGYYNSPPTAGTTPSTPTILTPPSSPFFDPGTPTTPGSYVPTPPFDPNSPPTPPFDPNSPPTPSFDPSSPPFGTWNYWSNHPGLILGLFGYWGTLGGAFGLPSIPGFGASMSLQQALSNTRTDGLGALYREGTASLLNSMVDKRFHFTTKQVRDSFVAAISSNKAATTQANLFKLANEGRLKPRA